MRARRAAAAAPPRSLPPGAGCMSAPPPPPPAGSSEPRQWSFVCVAAYHRAPDVAGAVVLDPSVQCRGGGELSQLAAACRSGQALARLQPYSGAVATASRVQVRRRSRAPGGAAGRRRRRWRLARQPVPGDALAGAGVPLSRAAPPAPQVTASSEGILPAVVELKLAERLLQQGCTVHFGVRARRCLPARSSPRAAPTPPPLVTGAAC